MTHNIVQMAVTREIQDQKKKRQKRHKQKYKITDRSSETVAPALQ